MLLLLVLLSGLPQIGLSLTAVDLAGERLTPVPLTRSLLLDKLPPEQSTLAPPGNSAFPPLLTAPAASAPEPAGSGRNRGSITLRPSVWYSNLRRTLYRHNSNYV